MAEELTLEGREPDDEPLEGDEPAPDIDRGVDVSESFLSTPISELSTHAPVVVPEDAPLAKVVETMRKKKIGAVMVVSKKRPRRLVGIFSERDLLQKALGMRAWGRVLVGKVMTRDPEALRPKDSVAYALNKMSVGRFRHLPLVDQNHVPVGMLSVRDVADFLVELIPEAILNLPPEPQFQYVKTVDGD